MSHIAFHFSDDTTLRIGGRERKYYAGYIRRMADALVDLRLPRELEAAANWQYELRIDVAQAVWPSVWAISSTPVRLALLFDTCCEDHLIIDGSAFVEVADAIDEGLRIGIFREETQGYDGIARVAERLRQGGDWCALAFSGAEDFKGVDEAQEELCPTLGSGELLQPSFYPSELTLLTMPLEELIQLTRATARA